MFITTKDVAKILKVSTEQVRIFVHRYNLPCYKLSERCLRFREDEVLAWARRTR